MTDQAEQAGNLNLTALIAAVASESGQTQATVRAVLRSTFDVIGRTVTSGHEVRVTNFGTWRRKAVTGTRNPQTGEPAGESATMAFRSSGLIRRWVRSGSPGATLAKAAKGEADSRR